MQGRRVGRPPKPTNLKLITGNPGKRPLNFGEMQPKVAIPTCPSHLNGPARLEWRRISPLLKELGLLTELDRTALSLYCAAWGCWVEIENILKALGDKVWTVKSKRSYPRLSPHLIIANQAMDQCLGLLGQFGLSPATRARVSPSNNHDPASPAKNGPAPATPAWGDFPSE
jgi:P27 family predicted phage terminase small subunit